MAKSATKSTRKPKSAEGRRHQVRETSAEGVEATQAREAGANFDWHYGRVSRLGNFEIAAAGKSSSSGTKGVSSQHGNIATRGDILKLAFMSTGRIAILSDESEENWRFGFRFLEAVR